jgi:hypothetical protein
VLPDTVLPDHGYLSPQGVVRSSGGMIINMEKPKKVGENPASLPIHPSRISHEVTGTEPEASGGETDAYPSNKA